MHLLRPSIRSSLIAVLALLFFGSSAFAQNDYYFPNTGADLDPAIPTPEQFLGYPIGSHYTRHDRLVDYFRELARHSDKITVHDIGESYQRRPLISLVITSAANQARIDDIRARHATLVDPSSPALTAEQVPVVVGLYYSVHGAETSSGEAALLTAYYLVADRSTETANWLDKAVVVIDPSQNPDGRDRMANWHNSWANNPPVADPADREHLEPFPGSRFNHYLTDLNRDWLAATQRETQAKLEFFHQWYPNVQIDFHEMGGNSTYYFEPSPSSMHSPLLPQASYDFNVVLARYHAQALDGIGSLYFTREIFDNFSPVYGSTYPDFHGAVGVTVEQGSSRGLAQEIEGSVLTFPFTVRNQVVVGLATVRGAVAEHGDLLALQKNFYRSALDQAARYPVQQIVFGDEHDRTLSRRLLELLLRHRIVVHELSAEATIDGKRFVPGSAWVVPVRQPQFRLVHAIFEETPAITESVYGSTSYAIAHAYGLRYARSKRPLSTGARITDVTTPTNATTALARYAYVLDWRDYNAFPALYRLLDNELLVRATFEPFTLRTQAGERQFSQGSLVVPIAGQKRDAAALHVLVREIATSLDLDFHAVDTGQSVAGIDLGSNSVKVLRKPSVALIAGQGVNPAEIGSTWFALSEHVRLPATRLEPAQLGRVSLARYTSIVFASGDYSGLGDAAIASLKSWTEAGGSLVTFGTATQWAIDKGLANEQLKPADAPIGDEPPAPIAYGDLATFSAEQRIAGNLLSAKADITHPLAFGLSSQHLFVNKETPLLLQPSRDNYATVVRIDDTPLINGYLGQSIRQRLPGAAWAIVGGAGRGTGNVVLFTDDPAHRKYWHGTDRLLLNALFFHNHLRPPQRRF